MGNLMNSQSHKNDSSNHFTQKSSKMLENYELSNQSKDAIITPRTVTYS